MFWSSAELLAGPDLLPPDEVKRLLTSIPIAHGGNILAMATYRISYTYKGEALEDAAAYGRTIDRRSEQTYGPMILQKGEVRIEIADWLPRELACELVGTLSRHRLSYRCLLANIYDKVPVGATSVQIRNDAEYLEYLQGKKRPQKISFSWRSAPNYLDLLTLLPDRIPYLNKPGAWGADEDDTIADLFRKVLAEPSKYEVTGLRDEDALTINIFQAFDRSPIQGAGRMWAIQLDAAKNFAPTSVKLIPGKRIGGVFQPYGYALSNLFSRYVEPETGIWVPMEIVAEDQRRLMEWRKPGEDTSWNVENIPWDKVLRISRHTVRASKIEVNGLVSDDDLAPKVPN
jgi:hypothetical protein